MKQHRYRFVYNYWFPISVVNGGSGRGYTDTNANVQAQRFIKRSLVAHCQNLLTQLRISNVSPPFGLLTNFLQAPASKLTTWTLCKVPVDEDSDFDFDDVVDLTGEGFSAQVLKTRHGRPPQRRMPSLCACHFILFCFLIYLFSRDSCIHNAIASLSPPLPLCTMLWAGSHNEQRGGSCCRVSVGAILFSSRAGDGGM